MYVIIRFSSDSSLKQQTVFFAVKCDCKIIYYKWAKPSPTCLAELRAMMGLCERMYDSFYVCKSFTFCVYQSSSHAEHFPIIEGSF